VTAPAAPPPFTWAPGEIHLDVLAGVAFVAAAYALALRRARRRPDWGRGLSFAAALLVLLAALNGPLHDLSDHYLFSAHMLQHLLLTLVVPPLLLAGTPGWMLDALLAPALARRPLRALVVAATRPLPALGLYTVALCVWHLPVPYGAALESHGLHIVQHLTFLATSVLAWWPVVSASAQAPRLHAGAQILYLFAFGLPMTAVAAMVTGAEELLYPYYAAAPRLWGLSPLADQRLGGLIMWVPAGLVPLMVFTVVFFRWTAAEHEPV
jgi:putative membrane protein